MKTREKLAAATAILMAMGGAALAAGDHANGGRAAPGPQGPGDGNHDMMQMMMRMHSQMGGSGSMGSVAMMGSGGPMSGMGMMGGGAPFIGMAMEQFDTDGDGTVTSQEAHEGLQALLAEYDADGDEALSLAEFETLHSALIRETMVDRFQFLDDDGDGAVTVAEIVKPADVVERMQTMRDGMMPGTMRGPKGGMMDAGGMQGNGGMMDDN
ncbi:EF-hand domain-containing protein [Paracoccus binzhouensis]|uniref:EF-hand domain-containing protein n=1 Tax=Paracoccus binzhouensis TaxID=2796149 RepID=UPI001E56F2D1|nr:calcium-binding protein [Paracoccus binzhouensis]